MKYDNQALNRRLASQFGKRQIKKSWETRREVDARASWGAALRSRTTGSQDESRCSAIHKPPHSILGWACYIGRREVVRSRCPRTPVVHAVREGLGGFLASGLLTLLWSGCFKCWARGK